MTKQMRANLLLLLTAMIWGVAFVAQDMAAEGGPPLTFNGSRMTLAALALLPTVWLNGRRAGVVSGKKMNEADRRTLLLGGVCCGVMLALGSAFQQLGITLGPGAGKAGFITALYIVMVPLCGIFARRRV